MAFFANERVSEVDSQINLSRRTMDLGFEYRIGDIMKLKLTKGKVLLGIDTGFTLLCVNQME